LLLIKSEFVELVEYDRFSLDNDENTVSILTPFASIFLKVLQLLVDLAEEFLCVICLSVRFVNLTLIVADNFINFWL